MAGKQEGLGGSERGLRGSEIRLQGREGGLEGWEGGIGGREGGLTVRKGELGGWKACTNSLSFISTPIRFYSLSLVTIVCPHLQIRFA